MLDQVSVDLSGPVPAKLIQGFNHGEARQANAVFRGPVAPQERLAFDEMAEIVEMGPLLVGGLLGDLTVVLGDKGELQVAQIRIDIIRRERAGLSGFR